MLVGVPFDAHQLSHDLRIGLAVEAMVFGSGAAEHVDQRAMHGALPRAVGQQDGSVDVEQNELHVRVSKKASHDRRRSDALPRRSASRGAAPTPSSTAMSGCKFEYIAVRVGPMTRTPRTRSSMR